MDANHVGHYFGDRDGALVVKWVDVSKVGDGPIAALGIGNARELDEVVARVRRFLSGVAIECDDSDGVQLTPVVCGTTLGEGWIKLFFDRSRRLREARVDAYNFT
jgi:hypothetical protein